MNKSTYILPSKKFKQQAAINSIAFIVISLVAYYLNFNPAVIFSEFHHMKDLLEEMFWPDYTVLWENKSVGISIFQTLSMAFLGTFYGGIIAVLFAFLSANNIFPNVVIRNIFKFILALIRVIPSLVVILIFVIAVGPGPFAGVLTLIFSTIGTIGKLFMEVLENNNASPSEAIYSVGASRVQVIRYAIFPQVLPSLISTILYAFDINMRAAIGLGIFGGGGIGYKLYLSMRVLHYRDATALITCIVILLLIVENISNYLRGIILNDGSKR